MGNYGAKSIREGGGPILTVQFFIIGRLLRLSSPKPFWSTDVARQKQSRADLAWKHAHFSPVRLCGVRGGDWGTVAKFGWGLREITRQT